MTVAVLLMAYGTPAREADIEPYYTHIRHGDPPPLELLDELTGRYRAIGGLSPLLEISRRQAATLEAFVGVPVVLGMKHAAPFIEDAVDELIARGVDEIVGVVLAPHYSTMSVAQYEGRVRAHLESVEDAPSFRMILSWHTAPGYLSFLAGAVDDALHLVAPENLDDTHVIFSAHSLPERILADHDPYPQQLAQTANAVGVLTGWSRWSTAWQSAGRTSAKWLGPDILDEMRGLAAAGTKAIVICACGFVTDHLEVLYDIDIEAQELAKELGIQLVRTESPNDDETFVRGLASVVAREVHAASEPHACDCDGFCNALAPATSTANDEGGN